VSEIAETADLAGLRGGAVEVRFSLSGRCAVRLAAPRGPVAPRHAEPPEPAAPWTARARSGRATRWLLAAAPPEDPKHARAMLTRIVERQTAHALSALARQSRVIAADVLDGLTHRLRTDVGALQAVAEGLLAGAVEPAERVGLPEQLRMVGRDAQDHLSAARELMSTLAPEAPDAAEPVVDVLRGELGAAGLPPAVGPPDREHAMAHVPGVGWTVCAREIAGALATDPRLGGEAAEVHVTPDPYGWAVTVGDPAARHAVAVDWTEAELGPIAAAGRLAAAAGGWVAAWRGPGESLVVRIVTPAAPSPPCGGEPG
jgi:hypothetical protein